MIQSLFHSRKFWLALVGVLQTVLFSAIPDFPKEVWLAIDGLIAVLIGAIALEDLGAKLGGWQPPSFRGVLESLRHSRKFWLAVAAVIQTIVFYLLPDFPDDLWQAIDGLIAVLIVACSDLWHSWSSWGQTPAGTSPF
jgi:uncharacterized membrane protein HdeD (DUF308 family)